MGARGSSSVVCFGFVVEAWVGSGVVAVVVDRDNLAVVRVVLVAGGWVLVVAGLVAAEGVVVVGFVAVVALGAFVVCLAALKAFVGRRELMK